MPKGKAGDRRYLFSSLGIKAGRDGEIMKEDSLQYMLYIDESGDFMSSSVDPAEQSSARSQKGTSQLVLKQFNYET